MMALYETWNGIGQHSTPTSLKVRLALYKLFLETCSIGGASLWLWNMSLEQLAAGELTGKKSDKMDWDALDWKKVDIGVDDGCTFDEEGGVFELEEIDGNAFAEALASKGNDTSDNSVPIVFADTTTLEEKKKKRNRNKNKKKKQKQNQKKQEEIKNQSETSASGVAEKAQDAPQVSDITDGIDAMGIPEDLDDDEEWIDEGEEGIPEDEGAPLSQEDVRNTVGLQSKLDEWSQMAGTALSLPDPSPERSDAIMKFVRIFVPGGVEEEDIEHFHSTLVGDEEFFSSMHRELLQCSTGTDVENIVGDLNHKVVFTLRPQQGTEADQSSIDIVRELAFITADAGETWTAEG